MADSPDRIAEDALKLVGADGAAWVTALGAAIPPAEDPWLAPAAGVGTPAELELPPRDRR